MTPELLEHLRLVGCLSGSLLLAGFVAWRLIRLRVPAFPPQQAAGVLRLPDQESKLRQHVNWLVELRWIAVSTVLLMVLLAVPVARVLPVTSFFYLTGWCLVLIVANLSFSRWVGSGKNSERQLIVQLSIDLVILTGLLNASGGVENPLYLAYVFPVVIAAILLPRRRAFMVAVLACVLFGSLAAGEALHVLPHYTLKLFPHPGAVQQHSSSRHPEPSLSDPDHASYDPSFVVGKSLPLIVALLITSYLASLLRGRLQESEDAVSSTAREVILEHQRLEGIVQAAGVGMMVVEPELKVRWFSRQVEEWLGWREGVRGGVCPLFEVEGGCRECVALRALEQGQAAEAERHVVKDGVGRYLRHAAQPVRDPTGRVIQVVELVDDITRRKALEAEALHAGKLSVLGHLAAGLAHEIGNPLASLSTRLKRLERERDPTFLDESIKLIRQQIERIGRTVRNVSLYSRNRPEEWSRCGVNEIVEEAVNLVRLDQRSRRVRFETTLAERSPTIRGVRDQIVQVVVNLVLNAMEAMPKGGVLGVESGVTDRGVELMVSDSGLGIPPDVRDRIFEPFVTTKPQGVGLGLAISRSLVQAHGGNIEVASLAGGAGTRFTVFLPRS